jgi:hypothetical protein
LAAIGITRERGPGRRDAFLLEIAVHLLQRGDQRIVDVIEIGVPGDIHEVAFVQRHLVPEIGTGPGRDRNRPRRLRRRRCGHRQQREKQRRGQTQS